MAAELGKYRPVASQRGGGSNGFGGGASASAPLAALATSAAAAKPSAGAADLDPRSPARSLSLPPPSAAGCRYPSDPGRDASDG